MEHKRKLNGSNTQEMMDRIKLIGELIPNTIVSFKLIIFLDQIYSKLPHLERLHFQIMYFLNEMWKISQMD